MWSISLLLDTANMKINKSIHLKHTGDYRAYQKRIAKSMRDLIGRPVFRLVRVHPKTIHQIDNK